MTQSLDDLYALLKGAPAAIEPTYWDERVEDAGSLITLARNEADAESANKAWHLAAVSSARAGMCRLFQDMRNGKFREAWNTLEQVEKMVEALKYNSILQDEFGIDELGNMVGQWQSLYPYTIFASPEIIIRKQECTICKKPVSPMKPCGHLPGHVYAGRICSRRITDLEPVSIALVRDPVQKYSVILPKEDPYDYARVRFVLERLNGPFSRWWIEHTVKSHDHALFDGWARDGNCPCHSGWTYAACCGIKPGVCLPHDQIYFEESVPSNLPQFVLRRRSSAQGELEDVALTPSPA